MTGKRSRDLRDDDETVVPAYDASAEAGIGEEWPPFLILACLTLLFLSQTPSVPVAAQLVCILAGIGGLVATVAVCRGFAENIGRAALKAPTLLLFLLTGWATFRFFTTPPAFKLLATVDLLRVYGGTLAFFACAYILGTARQLGRLVIGIALFAVFVAFADFGKFGQSGYKNDYYVNMTSVLGLHMTAGGFLAMLVPVIAAFAFVPGVDDKQRLAAQLTLLVVGFALVLARSRSGWVAGIAALLAVGALLAMIALRERWRQGVAPAPKTRRNEHPLSRLINSPLLWVAAGLVVLIAGGGLTTVLEKRGTDLGKIASGNLGESSVSVSSRLNEWRGALLMIRDKPVTGVGLGGFLVEQGNYTHNGDEAIKVLQSGTGHQNRAHNYYLEWGADTGLPGLFLHGAFIAAWLFAVVRALPVAPSPVRRALAIGAVGAVVAGSVDALSSPMYQLHGTYALWLAWAGIGLGALRADPPRRGITSVPAEAQPDGQPALPAPTPFGDWAGATLVGAAMCGLCIYLAARIVQEGKIKETGFFRVVTVPARVWQVRPGERFLVKALYTDENGVDRATSPGTKWQVAAGDDLLKAPGAGFRRLDADLNDLTKMAHAGLVLVPPPGAKSTAITVTGNYRDNYGRPYSFAVTVAVRPDAPESSPAP